LVDTKKLIRILEELPETRLRLIELCPKLLGKGGEIDPKKVAFYSLELEEATREAEEYSKYNREAVRCLSDLARSWR
jgi:hypothetical protein